MALVIGPVAVLVLLANPVIGVGTAVGMGLLILVRRVGLVDHTPDSPGESANASRVADVQRESLASKSD